MPHGVREIRQLRRYPDRTETQNNKLQFYENNKHKYEFLNEVNKNMRRELLSKKQQELRSLGARELNSIMNLKYFLYNIIIYEKI